MLACCCFEGGKDVKKTVLVLGYEFTMNRKLYRNFLFTLFKWRVNDVCESDESQNEDRNVLPYR